MLTDPDLQRGHTNDIKLSKCHFSQCAKAKRSSACIITSCKGLKLRLPRMQCDNTQPVALCSPIEGGKGVTILKWLWGEKVTVKQPSIRGRKGHEMAAHSKERLCQCAGGLYWGTTTTWNRTETGEIESKKPKSLKSYRNRSVKAWCYLVFFHKTTCDGSQCCFDTNSRFWEKSLLKCSDGPEASINSFSPPKVHHNSWCIFLDAVQLQTSNHIFTDD